MKKLFAVSDVHGHFKELNEALAKAGFDPGNEEHFFISCGDLFDRGTENLAVYEFVNGLERKILIRGNHEARLLEILEQGRIRSSDIVNGTDITIMEFFGKDSIDEDGRLKLSDEKNERKNERDIRHFIGLMLDYYETENYIFTHGWLPADFDAYRHWLLPDWRHARASEWIKARYREWFRYYGTEAMIPGKTIVCGHKTSRFACKFDPTRSPDNTDIFFGNGVAVIDTHTSYSGKVNVLVLNEEIPDSVTHTMRLRKEPFEKMKIGEKTVEMRQLDTKRKSIRTGDRICFSCAEAPAMNFVALVTGIYVYPDFESLYEEFSPYELGFDGNSTEYICNYMKKLYSPCKSDGRQAVAIRVELI